MCISIENNESLICADCGGACCQSYAGAYHPNDFGHEITEEFLESLFNPVLTSTPQVSIDWYENFNGANRKGFFLRPRHVGGDIVDPSYGEVCANLTGHGCTLDWDHRPWQCKLLVPNISYACGDPDVDVKYEAAVAWDKYHDLLDKMYKKYDKGTFTGHKPGTFEALILSIAQSLRQEEK